MLDDLALHHIADEQAGELVRQRLNLLEDVRADLRAAQAEKQRLRDAINRLKGEQGMPMIKTRALSNGSPGRGSGSRHYRGVLRRTLGAISLPAVLRVRGVPSLQGIGVR